MSIIPYLQGIHYLLKSIAMRTIFASGALVACFCLWAGCFFKNQYAELDSAKAALLKESGIPGVFATRIDSKTGKDTSNVIYHCAPACATTKTYFEYVVYPYTICTSPDFEINDRVMAIAREKHQDSIILLISEKHPVTHVVKDQKRFGYDKLFCRTVGGPWGAFLEDKEMCGFCGDGPHTFTLTLPGLSHNLGWVWFGTSEDWPNDAPHMNLGPSSISTTTTTDCNPSDHTNCGGQLPEGGEHPQ
jgi:hypothetical protein